ncbi:uncharacterized protein C2orf50-like isoform X2 [Gigantopelta aegis]|uniref:uncharacterized protein C2orf50-like isoform X2 n=1 Tax=Gigantopelta aegis TaxID=1735272 RepID=UPI001B88D864|nr:uncharacterized protein C2orf50-like isoform X2 [Gigantopelta aegis]
MSSGMVASYMLASSKSAYHESCIPKDRTQAAGNVQPSRNYTEGDFRKCNAVSQDTIWKQSVAAEKRCLKNWDEQWGFLTEFDAKGEHKEKEELPDRCVMFSDNVPNTNSGNYGSRLTTEPGLSMQNLEFQFFSGHKRRKMDTGFVCY